MVTEKLISKTVQANGSVDLLWEGGFSMSFASVADYTAWFMSAETQDLARQLCAAYGEARNPNLNSVLNKDFILDLSANQAIKVQ